MYEEAKKKGNPVAYKEFEGNRFAGESDVLQEH